MPADPIEATRNVTAEERQVITKHLCMGLIDDMARELARLSTGALVTGPEEVRLKMEINAALVRYVDARKSRTSALAYLTPSAQVHEAKSRSVAAREAADGGTADPVGTSEHEEGGEEGEPTGNVLSIGLPAGKSAA